ncbi:MAG: GTP diphosphokinase [Gammaproteobacteria bacterium]|nr:GTP diphosphokinase [Gammaproteobacteria bacterium]
MVYSTTMVYVETQIPITTQHRGAHEWLVLLSENRNGDEMKLIRQACELGDHAHGIRSQRLGEPFFNRAIAVASIISGLNMDAESIAAALLFEFVESTDLTIDKVRQECGETIATLVEGVIRMNGIDALREGGDEQSLRLPQNVESLRKLLLSMAEDIRMVLIKLADKLHQMRMIREKSGKKHCAVARDVMQIYAPLANRLGIWQLKWELEDLAFRHLEPATYKHVATFLDERRIDRQIYIDAFIQVLRDQLEREGVEAEIKGRPKHIYSIWKKMSRKRISFHELYDVRAVRVLTRDTASCYHALGVVHSLWPHVPNEFDDYIATPKENDYQSIHTAVVGPQGKTVEIQIRTFAMEEHAELGVAAHWRYKEGGRSDQQLESKIVWLRKLLEGRDEESADFIDNFRTEIFQDRVYVITPSGEVIDLPQGATPIDFAYYIHSEVGNRCRGAKVNGRIVPLTYQLQSGQQVEILTAKQGSPSRDWLNPQLGFMVTPRARAKARTWFRELDTEQNLNDGRSLLDHELQRMGQRKLAHESLLKHLRYDKVEEMLIALGRGDISSAQIATAISRLTKPKKSKIKRQRQQAVKRGEGDSEIFIQGVGNLLTKLSVCCTPEPGDPIVGYITVGRGVTIHRQECINILNLADEQRQRLIEVNWSEEGGDLLEAEIEVEAYDRKSLLKDVYTILADEDINITASQTLSDPKSHIALIGITLEVRDLGQLSRLLNRVNQLPNVIEAHRK